MANGYANSHGISTTLPNVPATGVMMPNALNTAIGAAFATLIGLFVR